MAFNDARKHAGHYLAEVARSERVTPHMVRVTFAGDDVRRLPVHGYDQWFRIFLPHPDGTTDFSRVPEQFGLGGYLSYLRTKSGVRPPFRNYTVRALRADAGELDVDFVAHGDAGVAGPWAQSARAGEQVMVLDQGRGFDPREETSGYLLVGDESALPAIAGILRDLERDAHGIAIVEMPDAADEQPLDAPAGFDVRWLPRADPHDRPGALALAAVRALAVEHPAGLHAYLAGEQALVAESRRHLVAAGVPKQRIDFVGYWRVGRAG